MLELRQAVFDADKNGGDVSTTLSSLQQFVTMHMNTELPKLGDEKAIQLKFTYEKLVAQEADRVAGLREDLNDDATQYCQSKYSGASFNIRSQCVDDYFDAHPISENSVPKEAYSFDFVSPVWTPDNAGWWSLAAAVLALSFLGSIATSLLARGSLKNDL